MIRNPESNADLPMSILGNTCTPSRVLIAQEIMIPFG
jgi:hypothetical protein